jgi:hypothetical protein
VAEPHLDRAKVYAVPEMPRGECGSEFVEPKIVFIKFRSLSDSLQIIEKIHLHVAARGRKYEGHVLFAFAFHVFRLLTSFEGTGISRSLYAFGIHPRSDLWLTRTVAWVKLMSDQYVYIALSVKAICRQS